MSIKVVIAAHPFEDDFGVAASPEDIETLEKQIKTLKESISLRVTEAVLDTKMDTVNTKIKKISEVIQTLKKELITTLENGQWKTSFSGKVETAIALLEQRYNDLNATLDKKMEKIPRLEAIETDINAIFIAQGEVIKKIISSEGERVRNDLETLARREDLLAILKKEAQNITWETNND